MGFCKTWSKFLLIVFNILFLAIALAAIALAVWLLVDPSFSIALTQEPTEYNISIIILLVTSILLGIVSIFGVCGSLRERSGCLFVFCSIILIILGAEISAGIWGYSNRHDLNLQARGAVKHTVDFDYHNKENVKIIFDTFQRKLECCGATDPSDWIGKQQVVIEFTKPPTFYTIPQSCCRNGVTGAACELATKQIAVGTSIDKRIIYNEGCTDKILAELANTAGLWMGVGITIIVLQILSLIFALFLIHNIKSSKKR